MDFGGTVTDNATMPDSPGTSNTPDLSVIVLSYNVKDLTRKCIQSIQDSTSGIEAGVIVVDDNSPDNSAAMVRRELGP